MTGSRFSRIWLVAIAVVAAVPATSSNGLAVTGPTKDVACKIVGCSKGSQKCADVHGELSDPLIGKASITWYCYEPSGPDDESDNDGSAAGEM